MLSCAYFSARQPVLSECSICRLAAANRPISFHLRVSLKLKVYLVHPKANKPLTHLFSFLLITGALFTDEEKDSQLELAFKYAVYRINKDRHILPNTTLIYDIQYLKQLDSFHATKKGKHRNASKFFSWEPNHSLS